MKKIHLAIVVEEDEKYYAFAESIRTGENLKPYIERHKANIFHLCESRKEAETLVLRWNATFMANNTYLFSEPNF